MRISKVEQETGVIWNEGEEMAIVWTVSRRMVVKLTRRLGQPTRVRGMATEWTFPKLWVRLPMKPRVLSAEAKARAAERLRVAREDKPPKPE